MEAQLQNGSRYTGRREVGQSDVICHHRVFSIHSYCILAMYLPPILSITYLAIPENEINLSPGTEMYICAYSLTTSMYQTRIHGLASANSGSCTPDLTFHDLGR
jgi:hypothetical protein